MHRFSIKWAAILLLSCCHVTLSAADELRLESSMNLKSDVDLNSDSEASEFSDFVEKLVTSNIMPAAQTVGMGITVVRSNSSTPFYWKGFGYRDRDNKLPVDEHTLFPVGQLPSYRTESISFRDLLGHRSCTTGDLTSAQYGVVNNPQEYIYRARYEQELFPFRTSWVYNNPMYVLAGHLIAEIAGESFDLLTDNLLTELGMTSSRLSKIDEDYANMPNFTQAYYIDENDNVVKGNPNLFRQVSVVNPAGGLVSTLGDMNKYISFHLNSGSVDGKEILSKDKYQWLTRIAAPIAPGQSYGLGLMLVYIPGEQEPLLNHNGYYPPYTGDMSVYPSLGVSIYTASSGPGLTKPITVAKSLHNEIFAYFLAKKTGKTDSVTAKYVKDAYEKLTFDLPNDDSSNTAAKNALKIDNSQTKTSAKIDPSQAVGKFGAPVQGELEISYKNETEKTLKLTLGIWGQADLEPLPDSSSFKIEWTSDIVMHHRSYADTLEYINILEFDTPDTIIVHFTADSRFSLKRNFTLVDVPEIPWDANSCGVKSN